MSKRRFHRSASRVCSRGQHPVCPKSRRRFLRPRVAARCRELLEPIGDELGWQIVAKEVMPDHGHVFVQVGPMDAPAAVMPAFKGRTARMLRHEFPYLRRFAKVLWSPSYFTSSVRNVSASTVRHHYIECRWNTVMVS